MSPGPGLLVRMAISRAWSTSSVPRWAAMAHPTTFRLKASSTTARYRNPFQVGT